MATTVTNNCQDTDLTSNKWCISDLFAKGEGTQLVAIPAPIWAAIKDRWKATKTGAEGSTTMVLSEQAGANSPTFLYNEPITPANILETLFPNSASETLEGLFFQGNALIFNPTIGQTIEANGVPYQTVNFSLPVGSSKDYLELVRYMQSKAWIFFKVDNDLTQMNVYGGIRGAFPVTDEVVEMMFSGNNDAKGEASVPFVVEKIGSALEFLKLGSETTNKEAIVDLLGYMKSGACKPNGIVVA